MLILVTDGANTGGEVAPLTAARLAAGEGVTLYTIGIGADAEQAGAVGLYGLNPGLDLDEPLLREIAAATGGEYFRARSQDELRRVARVLDRLEPVTQAPTTVYQATPLYPWPLAAAVLLSLLLVLHELWPQWPAQLQRRRR
ncbi:von Willebrand factor type A domain protein [compost metagenome]